MGKILDSVIAWLTSRLDAFTVELRDWIIRMIEDATTALRVYKRDFREWFVEFVGTSGGFWATVLFVVGVALASAYLQTTKLFATVSLYVEDQISRMRNGIGSVLGYVGYSAAVAVHNLALIFSPDYKVFLSEMLSVIATLSEDLRLGVSGISNALAAGRGIATAGAILAGIPETGAFARALESEGKMLDRWEASFERYARDPNLIFLDIDEYIVAPALTEMSQGTANIINDIIALNATIADKSEQIVALNDSVDSFVGSFPEDVQIQMDKTWAEITANFDVWKETYLDPLDDFITTVNDELERQLQLNELRTGDIENAIRFPGSFLARIALLPEPLRSQQLSLVSWITSLNLAEELVEIMPEFDRMSAENIAIAQKSLRRIPSGVVSRIPLSGQTTPSINE